MIGKLLPENPFPVLALTITALFAFALSIFATGQAGTVLSDQKISDLSGAFTGTLDDDDYFGHSVACIGDLDGDGIPDLAVGADEDDDKVGGGPPAQERGAVWILFMNTNGTVKSHQKISDTQGGFSGGLAKDDFFGWSVASIGDLDSDGNQDIVVGAQGDDDGGTHRGAVYVLFLNANGTVKSHQKISSTQGGKGPLVDYDQFGASVAGIGDVDGDGINDIAVGATGDDDGGANMVGAAYILFMNANGTVKAEQKISEGSGGFGTNMDDYDQFGYAITSMGDIDGDMVPDIAIGAMGDGDGGSRRGAVYILWLYSDGTVNAEQKISNISGSFSGILDNEDRFGFSLACGGDLDGDGISDLTVGARGDDDGGSERGAVWNLFLNLDGSVKTYQKISDTQGLFTGGLNNSDFFGSSVCNMGDLDGDGKDDIAVGAYRDDDGGPNRGAIWVLNINGGGALPIQLLSFEAERDHSSIQLRWTTGFEINNDYFTVERSPNGADFEEIMLVHGAGSSSTPVNYATLDKKPLDGISYYRLKQNDYDGTYTYSDLVAIKYENRKDQRFVVYPNPVVSGQDLYIEFENEDSGKEVLVVLIDQMSRIVYSKIVLAGNKSVVSTSEDISDLAAGIYLIVASSDNTIYQKRLLVTPSGGSTLMAIKY